MTGVLATVPMAKPTEPPSASPVGR